MPYPMGEPKTAPCSCCGRSITEDECFKGGKCEGCFINQCSTANHYEEIFEPTYEEDFHGLSLREMDEAHRR